MFKVGDKVKVLSIKESNMNNWSDKQIPYIGKIGTIHKIETCDFSDVELFCKIKFNNKVVVLFSLEKIQLVEENTPKFKIGDKVKYTNSLKHGKLYRNLIFSIKEIEKSPILDENVYVIHSTHKDKNGLRPSFAALESDIELVDMQEKHESELKVKVPVDGILMYYSDNKYHEKREDIPTESVSLNKEQSIYSNLFVSYNPHSYRLGLNCND